MVQRRFMYTVMFQKRAHEAKKSLTSTYPSLKVQ